MSKVVVVATHERCPAVSALRSECIPFELVIADDDFTYGRTLHDLWSDGEEFVTLEHDIVPFPGAVQSLLECESYWCTHEYPIGHSGKFGRALGIVRFSERLIQAQPTANLGWNQTQWNQLDAQVYGALQVDRKFEPCIHEPAVAHLTDLKDIGKVYGETHTVDESWVMPKNTPWSDPEHDVLGDLQRAVAKGYEQGLRGGWYND